MRNVEEHIRQAMEQGKFDNLPGKGKPLRMEENPHADPEWRLAYHVLKSGGFSLPWIDTLREIDADVEKARTSLARTWAWRQSLLSAGGAYPGAEAEWKRALGAFREQVTALNRRIRDYNLEAPSERFQRPLLDFERELRKLSDSESK